MFIHKWKQTDTSFINGMVLVYLPLTIGITKKILGDLFHLSFYVVFSPYNRDKFLLCFLLHRDNLPIVCFLNAVFLPN